MRILHIITRLIVGGAQQNTITSCNAQHLAGNKVCLVYGPIYGPEGSLLPEAQKSGAQIMELAALRRPVLPLHDWFAYRSLRKIIRQFKPDVVHTHSSKAGIVGRAAAWAESVPAVIHTVHGLPFHNRQINLVYDSYVFLERWAARRCHKILGVTQAMCDTFLAHGIGKAGMFEMVPSGMDISHYAPQPQARKTIREKYHIAPDAPVVGLLGRLDPLKGQDDLLDIAPELVRQFPGLKLMFVGGGWHRKHLEQRIQKEGLESVVIFTGLVQPSEVSQYLAAMDVNTLPSYQEGQPRTLVQSLLSGCVIVGYDAGGIPEVCLDGKTGRLAAVGNRSELCDAIASLLKNPEERQRMIQYGQDYIRSRFDHRYMIQRLDEIYRQVLDSNKAMKQS